MAGPCWRHAAPGHPPKGGLLVLHFRVDVKRLREVGRGYPWPRPARCPSCRGARLWGHGYAGRYFEGDAYPVWLKRYRCPDCRAVHILRPASYWARFRYSIRTILRSLGRKIGQDRWLPMPSRQAQQYWWRGFRIQASRVRNRDRPGWADLGSLLARNLIPVTHAIQRERRWA